MDIRLKFITDGSITFYSGVGVDQANVWRSMARHPTIWYSEMLDRTVENIGRIQALVPDEESRNMSRKMKRFSKTFIGDSETNDWRWVKTLAGSGDLPARHDFELPPGSDFMDMETIPGGIVVALDDDTCFYIYGWNHSVAMHSDRQLITLQKGNVFVCRGDLVFAPVGYEVNNVYLHAYLDTPMAERPEDHQPVLFPMVDDTIRFEDLFCFAWNCTFRGTDSPSVRRYLNRFHGFHFHHAPHTMVLRFFSEVEAL